MDYEWGDIIFHPNVCLSEMSHDKVFPLIRVETTMDAEGYRGVLRRFLDMNFPVARSGRSTIGRRPPQAQQPFTFHPGHPFHPHPIPCGLF